MAHKPLPVGHHTADEVAELLGKGWTKRKLYQRLRELGWLIIDKRGVKDSDHNLPRKEITQLGWAYALECSYGTGSNKEISKTYRIPVFTQAGYQQIKRVLIDGEAPPEIRPRLQPQPKQEPAQPKKHDLKKDPATQKSRDDALADLRKIL